MAIFGLAKLIDVKHVPYSMIQLAWHFQAALDLDRRNGRNYRVKDCLYTYHILYVYTYSYAVHYTHSRVIHVQVSMTLCNMLTYCIPIPNWHHHSWSVWLDTTPWNLDSKVHLTLSNHSAWKVLVSKAALRNLEGHRTCKGSSVKNFIELPHRHEFQGVSKWKLHISVRSCCQLSATM